MVQLTQRANGDLGFLSEDNVVLANIRPCEPSMPEVKWSIAHACAALTRGDLSALRQLVVAAPAVQPERLAA